MSEKIKHTIRLLRTAAAVMRPPQTQAFLPTWSEDVDDDDYLAGIRHAAPAML
ncbi:hypothetical protein [Cupriavidus necator]|uniref:hypothetical protein n=1 Tax=Cupriavidus necator TaxID=106590 RepID=UPI00278020CF|nr:hypothetical protein [Cupriavidus necator]MDQ0138632.1 hypothetical protein [Cupriavidus necator]